MKYMNRKPEIMIAAGLAAAVLAACGPAWAVDPAYTDAELVSLANAQLGVRAPKVSQLFADASSGRQFVLDRTGKTPLMKFADDEEVYALTSGTGAGGNELLKNDTGVTVLRISENSGAMTLFMTRQDPGRPVEDRGDAAPIALPASLAAAAEEGVSTADAAGSAVEAHLAAVPLTAAKTKRSGPPAIVVEESMLQYSPWAEDAVAIALKALDRSTSRSATGIKRIRVLFADKASASLSGGELRIGVAPHKGYAGRPSSNAIAQVLARAG